LGNRRLQIRNGRAKRVKPLPKVGNYWATPYYFAVFAVDQALHVAAILEACVARTPQ
jgi:hypothetical protein